ncbi:MAG: SDR family oxidoreductase [Candidatus Woesearchaeota archaeon]|nr:SDR family oxidoreductase [Candidatus Woesearchaeota archaeon]
MNRLESIVGSKRLEGKRILVTGCGYRPAAHIFQDIVSGEPSHDSIIVDEKEMKLNIGSAIACVLAKNGATVHMISTSPEKLKNLKQSIDTIVGKATTEFTALNLLEEEEVRTFVKGLPNDKPLYWVQSVGLGAGSYKLKDDNPYLPLEEIPLELLEQESQIVLRATHLMMRELLPRFRKQKESRIAIVSSMSAIRGYSYGGTHCAAKGAIDRYANAAMLALYKHNIFVTTIRPGGIDTGMYDNPIVQEAIMVVSDEYKGQYRQHQTYAPPTSVGEAITYVFTASAHIPSLNLVAKGQMPNEGS